MSPGSVERNAELLRSRTIPRLRELPGFAGAYWLADTTTGTVLRRAPFHLEPVAIARR